MTEVAFVADFTSLLSTYSLSVADWVDDAVNVISVALVMVVFAGLVVSERYNPSGYTSINWSEVCTLEALLRAMIQILVTCSSALVMPKYERMSPIVIWNWLAPTRFNLYCVVSPVGGMCPAVGRQIGVNANMGVEVGRQILQSCHTRLGGIECYHHIFARFLQRCGRGREHGCLNTQSRQHYQCRERG